MPSNKNEQQTPKKVTLFGVSKTSKLFEYATFVSQDFSSDLFQDKQFDFPEVISTLLGKNQSKGRIVVLSGKSGSGKTTFLKQVLSQVISESDKVSLIYLSHEKIGELNEQYFQDVLRLKNGKRKIIVVEDCNSEVVSNNSFVLNSSDGLLSESYDVSFIFTTSKGTISFRENRLAKVLHFGDLSIAKAQEIAIKNNPKFNKTKIRHSKTISEIMKELEDDKS